MSDDDHSAQIAALNERIAEHRSVNRRLQEEIGKLRLLLDAQVKTTTKLTEDRRQLLDQHLAVILRDFDEDFRALARESLRERLAAYAHDAWSRWMEYLFDQCDPMEMEDRAIPRQDVTRWERQRSTSYEDLPEEEKASDRAEADRILAILEGRS